MAALVEQVGYAQARRPRAHDCHRLAGAGRGRHRVDDAVFIAVFHDSALILLDSHRIASGHAAGAGGLAQGGAHPGGELRIAVGGDEPFDRKIPLPLIHQIIPLGDEVVQRTAAGHAAQHHAALAEGHTAVHAAGALRLLFVLVQRQMKFVKIGDAFLRRQLGAGPPCDLHKSSRFSHCRHPPYCAFFMA